MDNDFFHIVETSRKGQNAIRDGNFGRKIVVRARDNQVQEFRKFFVGSESRFDIVGRCRKDVNRKDLPDGGGFLGFCAEEVILGGVYPGGREEVFEGAEHGLIGSTVSVDYVVSVGKLRVISIVEKNPAGGIIAFVEGMEKIEAVVGSLDEGVVYVRAEDLEPADGISVLGFQGGKVDRKERSVQIFPIKRVRIFGSCVRAQKSRRSLFIGNFFEICEFDGGLDLSVCRVGFEFVFKNFYGAEDEDKAGKDKNQPRNEFFRFHDKTIISY